MSGTNWTPGPWASDIGSMETFLVKAADTSLVAWVNYRSEDDDTNDRAMQEANASLIAAAPDMYQALDEILYLMATIDVQTDLGQKEIAALIRGNVTQITAAMRKARGGLDPYGLPYPDEAVRR